LTAGPALKNDAASCRLSGEDRMRKIGLALATVLCAFTAQTVCAAGTMQQEQNKKIVMEFYEKAINRKDFEAASKYLGLYYIQHDQKAADGPGGLKGFIHYLREKFPNAHSEIKRAFADGDYVILQVHAVREPRTRGIAIIDIFRLKDGKIIEHWDVHEDILPQAANVNGMF
jgi:predicted SnoaL-like aldol condensation-catalyzing enzyme